MSTQPVTLPLVPTAPRVRRRDRPDGIFPHVVGVRLAQEDFEKLTRMAAATNRVPSDVLRVLLRVALIRDVPPIEYPIEAALPT